MKNPFLWQHVHTHMRSQWARKIHSFNRLDDLIRLFTSGKCLQRFERSVTKLTKAKKKKLTKDSDNVMVVPHYNEPISKDRSFARFVCQFAFVDNSYKNSQSQLREHRLFFHLQYKESN